MRGVRAPRVCRHIAHAAHAAHIFHLQILRLLVAPPGRASHFIYMSPMPKQSGRTPKAYAAALIIMRKKITVAGRRLSRVVYRRRNGIARSWNRGGGNLLAVAKCRAGRICSRYIERSSSLYRCVVKPGDVARRYGRAALPRWWASHESGPQRWRRG